MDGRRHSVDLPISKTLVALRRVRSLRDPETNSMTKLSSLADDLNWEPEEETDVCRWRSLGQNTNDYEPSFGSTICNQRQMFGADHGEKMSRDFGLTSGTECEEGEASCDEHEEIMSQLEKERCNGSKCEDWDKKLDALFGTRDSDVMSCSKRHSLSCRKPSKRRSMLGSPVFMDSCHQGCGLSRCWSRNLKFRDYDGDERRLLLQNPEQLVLFGDRESTLSIESPRNLCQKFMPKSFEELVGQNAIAASLLNAILTQKITSLYLFHGPSGTGKSSVSKIFAASLNCLSDEVNKPCGRCEECILFFSRRSRDVKEVDPRRMNKPGYCKSLIKDISIPPFESRYKVYIFEKCHTFCRETWTALLNSLHDLPRHSVFIMIAPVLDKLPHAVIGKALKFHFSKVDESEISKMLKKICVVEGFEFDQEALNFIAGKSNGSLRDAEMTLDQLSLLGRKITLSLVHELSGVVSDEELLDLLRVALSCDASNTVKKARELMSSRIDPLQLIAQLANLIMDILAGRSENGESLCARTTLFGSNLSESNVQQLSQALKILSQAEKQLRASRNQITWLTAALLQLSSVGSPNNVIVPRSSTVSQCPDGDLNRLSSTIESSKHIFPYTCEDFEMGIGLQDDKETLEFVWLKATRLCTSNSLKKFLQKYGKLVSIRIAHDAGTAVAELEFDTFDYVSKAEKSWKLIAGALQQMLGYNVELRINTTNILKKPKFSLFNCSRRDHFRSQFSSGNSSSLISDSSIPTSSNYTETRSSFGNGKGISKVIRDSNGNALAIKEDGNSEANRDRANVESSRSFSYENESKHGHREFLKFHCWKSSGFPLLKVKFLSKTSH